MPSLPAPSPQSQAGAAYTHTHHLHTLSPTLFLPRAAAIEPHATAIVHRTANNATLRRSYQCFADRARGLAYWLLANNLKRVGVVAPNTPAFLECIFGVVAAGAVLVPVNYRLKEGDVRYMLELAEVDVVVVDWEFEGLLGEFRRARPGVRIVVDTDTEATEGELSGPFDKVVLEGLAHDRSNGNKGWAGLHAEAQNEDDMLAIPFTSGTTSKPKGVVYTHRGAYLAALGNIIESGLNVPNGRCKYLWTLPM